MEAVSDHDDLRGQTSLAHASGLFNDLDGHNTPILSHTPGGCL